jgi:hypothetical protein
VTPSRTPATRYAAKKGLRRPMRHMWRMVPTMVASSLPHMLQRAHRKTGADGRWEGGGGGGGGGF